MWLTTWRFHVCKDKFILSQVTLSHCKVCRLNIFFLRITMANTLPHVWPLWFFRWFFQNIKYTTLLHGKKAYMIQHYFMYRDLQSFTQPESWTAVLSCKSLLFLSALLSCLHIFRKHQKCHKYFVRSFIFFFFFSETFCIDGRRAKPLSRVFFRVWQRISIMFGLCGGQSIYEKSFSPWKTLSQSEPNKSMSAWNMPVPSEQKIIIYWWKNPLYSGSKLTSFFGRIGKPQSPSDLHDRCAEWNLDSSDHMTFFIAPESKMYALKKTVIQTMIHLTTEQFSILPKTMLDELWPREDGGVSGSCSHMTSSLHDTALTCFCGYQRELCSQTVISVCS